MLHVLGEDPESLGPTVKEGFRAPTPYMRVEHAGARASTAAAGRKGRKRKAANAVDFLQGETGSGETAVRDFAVQREQTDELLHRGASTMPGHLATAKGSRTRSETVMSQRDELRQ